MVFEILIRQFPRAGRLPGSRGRLACTEDTALIGRPEVPSPKLRLVWARTAVPALAFLTQADGRLPGRRHRNLLPD